MSELMQDPAWPLPPHERERLEELTALRILDTPHEPAFDGVAEIAAALLEAPIAAITFVDDERQWFKASVGLDVCETGRGVSFCTHAILETRTLVVEDALLDPRFTNNPFVTGEARIRFYVGVPLRTYGGHQVGTLCVLDVRPRRIEPAKLRLLERLASMAVAMLEAGRPSMASRSRL